MSDKPENYEAQKLASETRTDATADAAKLLPCPFCGAAPVACEDDSYGNAHVMCQSCDLGFSDFHSSKTNTNGSLTKCITSWNTRPQSAPPEGELDGRKELTATEAANAFVMGWTHTKGRTTDGLRDGIASLLDEAYRRGQASWSKVEDEDVQLAVRYLRDPRAEIVRPAIADLLERLASERDEWKQQHENLVGVRQADIENLATKIDRLKAELERRKGDPRTRLHNLCEALQEDLDKSPYTREEWEQVDRQTVDLQRKLREAEAKLAEREA